MESANSPHICILAPHAYPLLARDREVPLIGGAELQMVLIARLLARRGWRISMVCLNYGQADRVMIDGVQVLRGYEPNAGLPVIRFVWPRLVETWRCMKRADADIYYQQTAGMLTGVMAKFCMLHGKRSIYASASNPDLARNTPRIQYARDRWIYEYGLRNVDRIFVQNMEQARLSLENFARTAHIVPNCYDIPDYANLHTNPEYVLWVSTIRGVKQPHKFLDLASALPQQKFVMVGGPDPLEMELYDSVRARAASLDNLKFEGFVPFDEVEKIFDRAAVFVNTSESEGVPNAFLQAWARGVPTVSFVDAGARFDGRPVGHIVLQQDEMLSEVDRLLKDDRARRQEGLRSREYVRTTHSAEAVVPLYERHFEELLRMSSATR